MNVDVTSNRLFGRQLSIRLFQLRLKSKLDFASSIECIRRYRQQKKSSVALEAFAQRFADTGLADSAKRSFLLVNIQTKMLAATSEQAKVTVSAQSLPLATSAGGTALTHLARCRINPLSNQPFDLCFKKRWETVGSTNAFPKRKESPIDLTK
ncbi:hypothetical protein D918_00343 [Trichuris suis]|nr:hypothetical protein D918_00343 [Trichuris suis]